MDRDLSKNEDKLALGEPSMESIYIATEDYDSGWDLGYAGPQLTRVDLEMEHTGPAGENTNRYGSQPTRKILA